MIRVLVDSGSTKTDWMIQNEKTQKLLRWQTRGINPSLMNDTQIIEILVSEVRPKILNFLQFSLDDASMKSENSRDDSLKTSVSSTSSLVHSLRFYGSGCRPEQCERMQHLLSTTLMAQDVVVASDLLGAARALCGNQSGIVCILGTGAASAHYNGESFEQSTPSLGYILGDEGSGTSLGKHLLSDILKEQLPHNVCTLFRKEYPISLPEIIQRVYREPNPNRFMSQFTYFLSKHLSEPSVEALVVNEFTQFFERNIIAYQRPELEVHFVGSVAFVFEKQLRFAASQLGLKIGRIVKAPLDIDNVFCRMLSSDR